MRYTFSTEIPRNQVALRGLHNSVLRVYQLAGFYTMQLNLFTTKRCTKCGEIKLLVEFHKNKRVKNGRHSQCRECKKQYREDNKEKIKIQGKQYREDNKDKIKIQGKKYREDNKDKTSAQKKKYREDHPEVLKERNKQWRQTPQGKLASTRHSTKRRELGFNPLNESFSGSIGHHINNNDVVYIPREVHHKCLAGTDIQKHRDLVMEYYGRLANMLVNKTKNLNLMEGKSS